MAKLYPFSQETMKRLERMPPPGNTHRWLAQVASGLSGILTSDQCFAFLRRCSDDLVTHRAIPDREISAAVDLALSGGVARDPINFGRRAIQWPGPDAGAIRKVLNATNPLFDGVTSTGLRPRDVLPHLFKPRELACVGEDKRQALVQPVEGILEAAEDLQFICVNPMRGPVALNHSGRASVRCQNNVAQRRHLVAEFDDPRIGKRQQAQLASALAGAVPFVMAVDSGGKSVHAWYRVDAMNSRDQARFFAVACMLGADPTRWDVCGWLRMPGGLRVVDDTPKVRQRILYFDGAKHAE